MNFASKKLFSALSFTALIAASAPAFSHAKHTNDARVHASHAPTQTDVTLRDLWLGHAFWVRAVVLETLHGNSAGATAAETAAVDNARLLSAALEPYYGKPASENVFALLAGHYTAAKHYLAATKALDSAGQKAARELMLDNAEQIAAFLSTANPHLPQDAVRGMLLAHGGHHVQQIQQLHDRLYGQEVQTWEAMKNHMYGIADAMTVALAKQFPARFK